MGFVWFGHHFAAISGAVPLIGPSGGACRLLRDCSGCDSAFVLGCSVHDFLIRARGIRRKVQSLAENLSHLNQSAVGDWGAGNRNSVSLGIASGAVPYWYVDRSG